MQSRHQRVEPGAVRRAVVGLDLRPKRILFATDLPRTRNMKILRRVVRAVLTGAPAGDLSSLLNPEAVDALRRTAEAIEVS